ncbi:hypothetical protein AB6A40_008668 [Gnathostoma spinigerum]|uniref:Uncharacterized protein n=1 Tax=Gnathostoma spinigerum TaxID=75299 RepID=A0ABD6EPR2_9BILA
MNGNLPNILSEDSQVAVPIRCTFNDLNAVFDGLSDEEDLKKGNEVCQQDVLSENSAIQTTIRNDEAKKSVTESTSTLIKLIDSLLQKLSSSFNLELFKDLPSSLKKLLCSDAEITVNGHEVEGIVRILENLSNNAFAGIPEGSTKSKEEHTSASGSELSNGHTDFVNKSEAHGTVGNDLGGSSLIFFTFYGYKFP